MIRFDSHTDKAGLGSNFICSQVLAFAGILSTTRCLWTSESSVMMFPTGVTSVSVGSIIRVKADVLKARCKVLQNGGPPCDKWDHMAAASVSIEAPSNAVPPTVSIVGPSQVGPCDRLPIDISGSKGSGGRSFTSVTFAVEGLHTSTSAVTTFLNANYKVDQVFEIPHELLFAGYAYNIIATMCNFMGGCGRSSLYVVVSTSSHVPVVSISSKQTVVVNRFSPLSVAGQAFVSTCNGTRSTAGLKFEWSLEQSVGPVSAALTSLASVSANPRSFKLNPFTLTVGATYTLTLTARHQESLKFSSSSVTVNVLQGSVVAVLSGGSERGVRLDGWVEIDASSSYDEDDAISTTQSLLLNFACVQTSPTYKNPSDLILTATAASLAKVIVTVPANASELLDSVHTVTVTVKHKDDFSRVSTKTIVIRVLPSNSPVITLRSESGIRINPSEKFKLLASIETAFPTVAQWTISDPSLSLIDISLSETEKKIGSVGLAVPHTHSLSLVLPPDTLPTQSTFSFYMTCTTVNGHSASAAITISTNTPPLPGDYAVTPETGGLMLTTEFTFVAAKWEDDDIPVTYEFAYQSSSGSYLVHRSRGQLSFTTAPLPAGRDVSNYALSTRLVVFDILDARHTEYRDVQVQQELMSAEDKNTYLSDALADSNGFPDEMKLAIATTSSIVNSVNCSTAPDCSSLNREVCSSRAGMCGTCKADFIGESGHANSYCLSVMGDQGRRLQHLSPWSAMTMRCDADDDCLVPHWHVCVENVCAVRSKECAGDCSGIGSCEFVSVYYSNVSYSECSVLNTQCRPQCICPPGRIGVSCELKTADYKQTLVTRHRLVEAIRDVSLQEDAARDTVVSWIEGIAAVCTDRTGVADETKVLMAELTIGFLHSARELELSYEMVASVSVILDLVLDVHSGVLDSDVTMELLEAYTRFVANDIVVGQNSVELVNELFRSSFFTVDGQSSTTLTTPLSALENLVGTVRSQRADLPQFGSDTALKITMVETASSMDRSDGFFVGVPLGIRFNEQPCSSLDPDSCVITVVLQIIPNHQEDGIQREWEPMNHTLECNADEKYARDFACPGGLSVTLTCNGSAGILEQPCPRSMYETYCSSIGDDTSSCRMIARSASNITCECNLWTADWYAYGGRRLQETPEESSSESSELSISVVAAGKSTLKEFTSTWSSAADLNSKSVVHSMQVLITVGSLAAFGIAALCFAARADYLEVKVKATGAVAKLTKEESHNTAAVLKRPGSIFNSVSPPSQDIAEMQELQTTKMSLTLKAVALQVKKKLRDKKATKQRTKSISQIARGVKRANSIMKLEEMRIDESLPMVLRALPLWKKFSNEVQMHHRWIGVLCHFSPTYSRPVRILSLLINILVMLFVQSVTYNIADPDDGTCESLTDRESCLTPKSSISSSEDKCHWDNDGESCHFRPFEDSIERVIVVALFAAVISAPFAVFLQSLILFVLAAETAQAPSKVNRSSISAWRQSSGTTHDAGGAVTEVKITAGACTVNIDSSPSTDHVAVNDKLTRARLNHTSLFSDFNDLMCQLQAFRMTLSVKERKEFDRIWGLSDVVDADSDNIRVDNGVRCSRLLSKCGKTHYSYKEKILIELSSVQRAMNKESLLFENVLHDDRDRSKRLLFLFIKDLMDGVNGDILDGKDRIDNALKRRVPIWSKYVSWSFLFVMSMGMLFYIYLFAIEQSESRQQSWFTSFVIWLIFEILLASSGLVLLKHILIPMIAMGDLCRVKKQVVRDIMKFRTHSIFGQSFQVQSADNNTKFNAAKFFFPSYKLAMAMPGLSESNAILHYSTPYPKNALNKKAKSVQKNYDMRFNFVAMCLSRVLIYAVTSIISLPDPFQNMLLELVSVSGLSYAIVIHIKLFNMHPALAFSPAIAVTIIIHFLTVSGRANTRLGLASAPSGLKKVAPLGTHSDDCADSLRVSSDAFSRTRGGLKTRRQSVTEGVAMVDRLAKVLENESNFSSDEDKAKELSDGNPAVDWEDDDDFHPDLEANRAIFGLSGLVECDAAADIEEYRKFVTTMDYEEYKLEVADCFGENGNSQHAGMHDLSDSDGATDLVIRNFGRRGLSTDVELNASKATLGLSCPVPDVYLNDSTDADDYLMAMGVSVSCDLLSHTNHDRAAGDWDQDDCADTHVDVIEKDICTSGDEYLARIDEAIMRGVEWESSSGDN